MSRLRCKKWKSQRAGQGKVKIALIALIALNRFDKNRRFLHPTYAANVRRDSLSSFAEKWSTIFSLVEETEITKSNLLTTLPVLKKEWRVSFEFKANSIKSGLAQIFHMTIDGKGIGKGSKKGDRTPAVWMQLHNTKGLLIISTVGTKITYLTPSLYQHQDSGWILKLVKKKSPWVKDM